MFFNDRYKKYHIGNIVDTRFKDLFNSEKYWKVMASLTSNEFDAHKDCGTLCLQHKVNEYLWDLKKGNINLKNPENQIPEHVNFI